MTDSLTWNGNELALWATVLVLPAAIFLAAMNWHSHGRRAFHGVLEILRVVLVLFVLILLWQPEWTEETENSREPTLVVLSDFSASMETRDVVSAGSGPGAVTRSEVRDRILETNRWGRVQEQIRLVFSSFGEETEGSPGRSNLHEPLRQALDNNPGLQGIVMISDGDWNSGPSPSRMASALRLADVPVIGVALGSAERLPDIRITDVAIPGYGVAGKSLRIPVSLRSSMARPHPTTVTLQFSNGEKLERAVAVPAMNRAEVAFEWKPPAAGDYSVEVSVPAFPGEAIAQNNIRTVPFQVREESIQVLVVDSLPRWEYRYLRNALSRDPGIELSCLLFHPGLTRRGGGNDDYIEEFPATINELSRYDVVVLGDVGISGDQLTPEQCRMLRGVVENQAAGLILIPGMDGNQLSLSETELDPLIPVQFDFSQPLGWGTRDPEKMSLSREGRRSLLTRLGDTEEENVAIWEELPGFNWYAPVIRARAGSQVLATHQAVSNQYGLLPLLATRTQGQGKILFMGTDSAWRWREGVEDQFHYRFWGQVIRWMAYQRNLAEGQSLRLIYFPERPEVQKPVKLSVNAMGSDGEPLQSGDVRVRLVSSSGQTRSIRLESSDDEWGLYEGTWTPEEAGEYQVRVENRDTGDVLDYRIPVDGQPLELVGEPARPDVLRELVRLTGGEMLRPENLTDPAGILELLPEKEPVVRRTALWSNPWTLGVLAGLFAIFWILRKKAGLI